MNKKKETTKINWFYILIFIIVFIFAWKYLIGAKNCKSDGYCFEKALEDCDRAKVELDALTAIRTWEIEGKQGNYCKIKYQVYSLVTIEKECLIPKGTILEGNIKMQKVADILNHLENCSFV